VLLRTQLTNDFFHFTLPSNCNEIRIETSIFATSPLLFSPATELARSQPVCTLNRHLHQPSLPCEDYDSSQKNDTGIHDERPTHTVASSLDSSQSQHNKFPPNQNKIICHSAPKVLLQHSLSNPLHLFLLTNVSGKFNCELPEKSEKPLHHLLQTIVVQ
jgi:hypothetical protein